MKARASARDAIKGSLPNWTTADRRQQAIGGATPAPAPLPLVQASLFSPSPPAARASVAAALDVARQVRAEASPGVQLPLVGVEPQAALFTLGDLYVPGRRRG